MPWYFPLLSFACVKAVGLAGGSETIPGISTESSWNRERFATSRRLNGVEDSWPSRIGFMKRGQRRRQIERKEWISRPECLARESKTAEVKRDQVSCVSFAPPGSWGLGSVEERIFRSSGLV